MKKALVILSYNHLEQTQQCLRSITDYLYLSPQVENNWRPILIHNGSRPEIVATLQAAWRDVDHLILPHNIGYTGGMNAGLNYAFSKYDAAVVTTNDTLLRQLPRSLPLGIGVPVIYRRNTNLIDSCGGRLNLWNGRLRHLHSPDEFHAHVGKATFYIPGAAFSIDRASWQTLSGFDEELFCYWEDVDLSLRANQFGIPIHLPKNFAFSHKIGKTTRKKAYYTSYLFQRNRRIVMQRYARHFFQRFFQQLVLLFQDLHRALAPITHDPERAFWSRQRHNLGVRLDENSYSLVKANLNR